VGYLVAYNKGMKMNDFELNKLLHEKVMGKCWHEWSAYESGTFLEKCGKCGETVLMGKTLPVPSYTTNPAEYWELLQEVSKKPYWKVGYYWSNFIQRLLNPGNTYDDWIKPEKMIRTILLDMPKGCSAILEFFGKEGE